jgi:hypothetical protein
LISPRFACCDRGNARRHPQLRLNGIQKAFRPFCFGQTTEKADGNTEHQRNGQDTSVEADTPLLWVIREHVGLTGTKYGCGVAQCGACSVHINGEVQRFCSIAVGDVKPTDMIVTIEGLSVGSSHPVQIAWAAVDVDAGRGGGSIPPQFCPVTNRLARVSLLFRWTGKVTTKPLRFAPRLTRHPGKADEPGDHLHDDECDHGYWPAFASKRPIWRSASSDSFCSP